MASRSERDLRRYMVALLAEGVDRNTFYLGDKLYRVTSPSSRRAWIEITVTWKVSPEGYVALLAEGVDRNFEAVTFRLTVFGRPPRGGRG